MKCWREPVNPADGNRGRGGDPEYDLIVIGAGCAGMAAALFASIEGMKVLLLERTHWVGGTSALAAGALWIPNTHLAAGSGDDPEKASRYLDAATQSRSPARLRRAFLALGPKAVKCLEEKTAVQMRAFPFHPDYLSELPGSSTSGRVLECLPFDGRRLGSNLAMVRPPIPEFTVLGGMMVDRIDIGHLLKATRSSASFAYSARLLIRYGLDRLRYRRGARLVMGNALIGRLLLSLQDRSVPIWRNVQVKGLITVDQEVFGVDLVHNGRAVKAKARCGVVLAGGGFNDNPSFRERLIPGEVRLSPRALTSTGILQQHAIALGGRFSPVEGSPAFWAPVSARKRVDGSVAAFPHFVLDRAKPGTVVVDASGKRFVNESTSYHLFGERMLERAMDGHPRSPVYLVADHEALVKYGLGMVRPGAHGIRRFLRDGYVIQAPTIQALADKLGIDSQALQHTAERMNHFARTGIDEDFHRGETVYQRNLGDPDVRPNPTLGPIQVPPFNAIRLHVGDIAASVGLVTDEDARVLHDNDPIPGLYAVGNDMQSVMGSAYPGPGINLGPAIVFAYAAAQAAKRRTPVA